MSHLRDVLTSGRFKVIGGHLLVNTETNEPVPLTPIESEIVRMVVILKSTELDPVTIMGEVMPDESPWSKLTALGVFSSFEYRVLEKLGEKMAPSDEIIPLRIGMTKIGDLEIDHNRLEAKSGGKKVPLTKSEFLFLVAFASSYPLIVSPQDAARAALRQRYSIEEARDAVKVYVRRIRKKIEEAGGKTTIGNRRGFGYYIETAEALVA